MNQTANGGSRPGPMGPPLMGLARYGSAPGSFLSGIADSVVAGGGGGGVELSAASASASAAASEGMMARFFPGESPCLASESSCRAPGRGPDRDAPPAAGECPQGGPYIPVELQQASAAASPLVRHSSLPSGFFSHLLTDHGHAAARTIGNYSQTGTESIHVSANRRLKSQWSFSRKDSLSQISELSIPEIEDNNNSDEGAGNPGQTYISGNFQLGLWDDNNSIEFSAPSRKRTKHNIHSQFSLPRSSSEMSELDQYLQIQQDSIPCRVRAKRGCATHPRSIAERERRTRISKRLQKLQDLVPKMDKQTSTSDMLELAIEHIKELQNQVQKLKQDQASCTCLGKQEKT
ncbi:hypothetical protein Cni_G27541 [Canna indica]|uniref:BHLH domain-containing protein n=1 Tax=Canna indica TaxID=4628 RepID=A0AAQ3L1W6_9LILI|nr:hypothetical protein Cni_G27541 [Canna indica]